MRTTCFSLFFFEWKSPFRDESKNIFLSILCSETRMRKSSFKKGIFMICLQILFAFNLMKEKTCCFVTFIFSDRKIFINWDTSKRKFCCWKIARPYLFLDRMFILLHLLGVEQGSLRPFFIKTNITTFHFLPLFLVFN